MQNVSHAVMAQRHEALDSLDDFPTPPWATRALVEHVLRRHVDTRQSVWEPACGRGLMSETLREYFPRLIASDIHAYPDFLGSTLPFVEDFLDPRPPAPPVMPLDWIITNPPFRLALDFALRAFEIATEGVALLVRTSWLEGAERYERLFKPHPPSIYAQFCERVPMVKGRWDPNASTATSYAWVVWLNREEPPRTRFAWIPPGQRTALTRPGDLRLARTTETPLLEVSA
jgi:hypothetical protein